MRGRFNTILIFKSIRRYKTLNGSPLNRKVSSRSNMISQIDHEELININTSARETALLKCVSIKS
jgi:hypothetical protein